MEKIIGEFNVKRLEILDQYGKADESLIPKEITDEKIKQMYEGMVLTRTFDDISFKMQREGRIGTYAQTYGQEAQVGTAFAMNKEDWFFPSFREHGIMILKGVPLEYLLTYFGGGAARIPDGVNCLPISIPVGSQSLHAVGAAMAFKKKNEKKVAVVYFGDGGTSEGDFHEAMNFAGVFKIPCVLVCQNNQWAISVPRSKQTAAKTIAQKAIAYGFEGIQVDGNDVFAVYKVMKEAIEKARNGGGPTFVEIETYRMGHHTTSDDATRYRDEKEVREWAEKDPVERLRVYMEGKGLWNKEYGEKTRKDAEDMVSKAVKKFEELPEPKYSDIFNNVYGELTENLKEQREYLKQISKLEEEEK